MVNSSLIEFSDKINSIFPLLTKELVNRQVDELFKGKITLPQFLILDFLYKAKESTMTNIAKFMSVTTAATTGIVDRLFREGYVIRVNNPEDRRIILVKPTSKGKTIVDKIRQQKRAMIINIFGKISEEERCSYLDILLKIYNILTQQAK